MSYDHQVPILCSAAEAAALLGVSRATYLRMDQTGRLGPRSVRLGRLVRWHRAEIEAWAAAGCPPRVQWLRVYGHAYGDGQDSGKYGISRPAGRPTSRMKIREASYG